MSILFLVRFQLLNGHLLGNSCSLGWPCVLCIVTICNLSYFPFWFLGLDLGSDCFPVLCIIFTIIVPILGE